MPIITGLPSTLPPSGPATGDLTGTYPAPTLNRTKQYFEGAESNTVGTFGGRQVFWNSASSSGANQLRVTRVAIPFSGTLHDVGVFVGTSSGNGSLAVYDTGQTTAGTATRLATSGAVALPGSAQYWTFDPNIAVTAGTDLIFAMSVDNGTATFAMVTIGSGNQTTLPASFLTSPAFSGRFAAFVAGSHPAPSTIADASWSGLGVFPVMIGRIT